MNVNVFAQSLYAQLGQTLANGQGVNEALGVNTNWCFTDPQTQQMMYDKLRKQKYYANTVTAQNKRFTKTDTVEMKIDQLLAMGIKVITVDDIANKMMSHSAARRALIEFPKRNNKYLTGITVERIDRDSYRIINGVTGEEDVRYYPDMSGWEYIQNVAKETKTTVSGIVKLMFASEKEIKETPDHVVKKHASIIRDISLDGKKITLSLSMAFWFERNYLAGKTRFIADDIKKHGTTISPIHQSPLGYLSNLASLSIRRLGTEYEIFEEKEVELKLTQAIQTTHVYDEILKQLEFFNNLKITDRDIELKLGMEPGELKELTEKDDTQQIILKQLMYISTKYGTRKVPRGISLMMKAERLFEFEPNPYIDHKILDSDWQAVVIGDNKTGYRSDLHFKYDKSRKEYAIVQAESSFQKIYSPESIKHDAAWNTGLGDSVLRISDGKVFEIIGTRKNDIDKTMNVMVIDNGQEITLTRSEYLDYSQMAQWDEVIIDALREKESRIMSKVA